MSPTRSIEKRSRLGCRSHSRLVYTGRRDVIMPAHLRRGHDPPRAAHHARRLDPASPATGHRRPGATGASKGLWRAWDIALTKLRFVTSCAAITWSPLHNGGKL